MCPGKFQADDRNLPSYACLFVFYSLEVLAKLLTQFLARQKLGTKWIVHGL